MEDAQKLASQSKKAEDGGQIFGQMHQMDHLGRVIWRYVVKHDGHVPEETEHFCGECSKCMWTHKWNIILGYEKP
ncbi:hypothetical protein HYE67_008085 [Fusarium culmorum]|uniref:Uncharacterized protein n=1 Tax=Fusarium culmorum TaxID=5516 RepID=A0A2T4HB52_FUSCU|nr:hypothetical protein FCULG_00002761 [Fusarium culmorum]QPC65854.1 hypothetical protein HYE67_008085 [Fusarium culmorum]